MRAERLDGMARLFASLEWPFTIHYPDELRQAIKSLADRLTQAAEQVPGNFGSCHRPAATGPSTGKGPGPPGS